MVVTRRPFFFFFFFFLGGGGGGGGGGVGVGAEVGWGSVYIDRSNWYILFHKSNKGIHVQFQFPENNQSKYRRLCESPRDYLKYFEISVPRHTRFEELRKQ